MNKRVQGRIEHRLNLNAFTLPVLAVIATIGLGLPGLFFLVEHILAIWNIVFPPLRGWIDGALFLGGGLLILFFLFVILEQAWDRAIYHRYQRSLATGQRLLAGECLYCGNRRVQAFERFCRVCGKELKG